MKPIPQAVIETVGNEMEEMGSRENLVRSQDFVDRQRNIVDFVLGEARTYRREARGRGLCIAHMIFRIFERCNGSPLPQLGESAIERAWEANDIWMSRFEGAADAVYEAAMISDPEICQHRVLAFAVVRLGDDVDVALTSREQGGLFVILKTVIDALDAEFN